MKASLIAPALFAAVIATAPAIHAVPAFARQMNMSCTACHTEFPQLNDFGRLFKLSGYTMSTEQTDLPPIAVMFQPSFTHTQKGQAGGAAPGFKDNNNAALTQASVFYAGRLFGPYAKDIFGQDVARIVNKIGIFSQTTYNGISKTWAMDNTELRFANIGTLGGKNAIYGIYLNNNPTMEDPWNTTPAWGYPFAGSGLAPTPAAAPLINGGLAHQVAGAGAYIMYNNSVYFNAGGYHTLPASFQNEFGTKPAGESQIPGVAPYWRLAIVRPVGSATLEVGTFGLAANTYPGRDPSAGKDQIVDVGIDSQYQTSIGRNDITALFSYVYEDETWNASQALGNTSNPSDVLKNAKVTVDYLFDKTYGGMVQYFSTSGDSDASLYSGSRTGSPDSDGFVLQANYLPFNKGGGPSFWPRSNLKLSVQYTFYNNFDGAKTNYDGAGANARDNNTLYFEAWIVF
ncbi:MAG TPA: hypothetical protein VGX70_19670 [Gemmataceae bacterium]|nr:hypothetical protein [Gemmataceae bacterium]